MARAGHRRRPSIRARTVLRPDVGLVRARAVASRGWAQRRGSMGPRAWGPAAGLLPQAWGSQPGRMCRTHSQLGAPGTLRPVDARPVPGMPRAWGPAAAQRVSGRRRCRGLLQRRGTSARGQSAQPDSASRRAWAEWELRQAAPAQGRPPSVPASVRQCWARQALAPACRRWPPQLLACPGWWSRKLSSRASLWPAWARQASSGPVWPWRGARGRRSRHAGRPTGRRRPRRGRRRAAAGRRRGGGEGWAGS